MSGRDINTIADELRPVLRANIADLAETLLGAPNSATRNKRGWRWGRKGSCRVFVAGPKQGAWTDFEANASGDPLSLIMHQRACGFADAVLWGANRYGIATDGQQAHPINAAALAERDIARKAEQARKQAEAEADEAGRIAYARALAKASVLVAGTIAERYLIETRGIQRPSNGWPEAVRYHRESRSLLLIGTDNNGEVRFVQRVYLTADARKISPEEAEARNLPAPKTTNGLMTGAYVRLPGPADGALMLAEGPESGLSVWAATQAETWLSIGAITRHKPPLDRRVVICRDDDKPQSPAAKALSDALRSWGATGADIVVATPWIVRRGDKSDFNDTIKDGGAEAVRARIDAALLTGFKAPVRHDAEDARKLLKEPLAAFFNAVKDRYAAIRNETKRLRAELTATAEFPDEIVAVRKARAAALEARRLAAIRPRTNETRAAAEAAKRAWEHVRTLRGAISDEARKAAQAIGADIAKRAKEAALGAAEPVFVHGIRADVGLGKSSATRPLVLNLLQSLRDAGDKRNIAIAIPTHALGDEQADKLNEILNRHDFRARVWRSRRARISPEANETMCLDLDAVRDAEEAMLDPQTAVCQREMPDGTVLKCAFSDTCQFQKQREAKADVWLMAHELLFHQKPVTIGDIAALIVDESPWQDGLFGTLPPIKRDGTENTDHGAPVRMALDTLLSDATISGDTLATAELRARRRALHDALSAGMARDGNGPIRRADLIAAGLTVQGAEAARKLEWQRKVKVDIRPGMSPAERKELVAQAARNKAVRTLALVWAAVAGLLADEGADRSGWLALRDVPLAEGSVRMLLVKGRKAINDAWHVPTLLIDATLAPDLLRHYWPRLTVTADIATRMPHQRIIQIADRSYSKGHLHNERNMRRLHAILCRHARLYAHGRALAVAQKAIEEQLPMFGPLPVNLELAHHNAVAGRDEWGPRPERDGVTLMILVGRTMPSPEHVENMAEALTGRAVERLDGWYPKVSTVREMADGTGAPAEADCHPDPICEAIRWHIAEGELVQIIGRPRGVNRTADNPVDILALVDCPLPLPVNQIASYADLEPTPADLMMAAGGVALESPADAVAAYSMILWDDREEAKKAFQRGEVRTKPAFRGHSPIKTSNTGMSPKAGICPNLLTVAYQVAGKRREPTFATYDPAIVPDLAAWLTERVGCLTWFGEKPEPKAPKVNVLEAMAERGLVIGGAHAFALYPDLFPSEDAARKAISRATKDQPIADLPFMAPLSCIVRYQVAGTGMKPALLYTTPERLPGLRSELETVLGPLAEFELERPLVVQPVASEMPVPVLLSAPLIPSALWPQAPRILDDLPAVPPPVPTGYGTSMRLLR